MTPLLPDLDFRFGSRYVRRVDDSSNDPRSRPGASTTQGRGRRRPLSPEAAAKRDARAKAFAQAAAAQYKAEHPSEAK